MRKRDLLPMEIIGRRAVWIPASEFLRERDSREERSGRFVRGIGNRVWDFRLDEFDHRWNRHQRRAWPHLDAYQVSHTDYPGTLTSVDLNGDGHPDLVVVSADEITAVATLSVFLGNGDGTYQASPTNYPDPAHHRQRHRRRCEQRQPSGPDRGGYCRPRGITLILSLQVFLNNGHGVFGSPINGPAIPGLTSSRSGREFRRRRTRPSRPMPAISCSATAPALHPEVRHPVYRCGWSGSARLQS